LGHKDGYQLLINEMHQLEDPLQVTYNYQDLLQQRILNLQTDTIRIIGYQQLLLSLLAENEDQSHKAVEMKERQ
jgi:hypothetical protein